MINPHLYHLSENYTYISNILNKYKTFTQVFANNNQPFFSYPFFSFFASYNYHRLCVFYIFCRNQHLDLMKWVIHIIVYNCIVFKKYEESNLIYQMIVLNKCRNNNNKPSRSSKLLLNLFTSLPSSSISSFPLLLFKSSIRLSKNL